MADIQTTTILNLAEKTSLDSADAFVIDTASGTKKITQENIIDDTLEMSGKFADAKAVGDAIDAQGTTLSASIATNTANIATNTANIATNTTDIADLKADLTAEQEARESAINAITMAYNTETKKLVVTLPEAD